MKDYPRVIYKETPVPHDYSEALDNIFKKLANEVPEKLIELRKQQILNHSNCTQIIHALDGLANLIGQIDNEYNRLLMKQYQEELIIIHSPVHLTVPINIEPLHKWETWTFVELYDKYIDLAMRKGWEDYYSLTNDFSKNKHKTPFGMDFDIDYDSIKNYHILDMVTDLILNDEIICGYEFRSFMNTDNPFRLLDSYNHDIQDKVIAVKLKEKYASMKEYSDDILNSFKKEE